MQQSRRNAAAQRSRMVGPCRRWPLLLLPARAAAAAAASTALRGDKRHTGDDPAASRALGLACWGWGG